MPIVVFIVLLAVGIHGDLHRAAVSGTWSRCCSASSIAVPCAAHPPSLHCVAHGGLHLAAGHLYIVSLLFSIDNRLSVCSASAPIISPKHTAWSLGRAQRLKNTHVAQHVNELLGNINYY